MSDRLVAVSLRYWRGFALWLCAVASLVLAVPASPDAQTSSSPLTIEIFGLRHSGGVVRLSLCDNSDCYRDEDGFVFSADIPALGDNISITTEPLPEGNYALIFYHDENDNRRFDVNFLGLPEEGFGFSRDAPILFGKPDFDEVSFRLTAGASIRAKMRYF